MAAILASRHHFLFACCPWCSARKQGFGWCCGLAVVVVFDTVAMALFLLNTLLTRKEDCNQTKYMAKIMRLNYK
eukprot:3507339-Ditylum_brightwellii.AAC.1